MRPRGASSRPRGIIIRFSPVLSIVALCLGGSPCLAQDTVSRSAQVAGTATGSDSARSSRLQRAERALRFGEAQDGNNLNAQYARSATEAIALGLVVSRVTKRFVHRARPCTGGAPGDVFVRPPSDTLTECPRGSAVRGYSSFFSEHTMALLAIASAAAFQAQRQNAPNASMLAAATRRPPT